MIKYFFFSLILLLQISLSYSQFILEQPKIKGGFKECKQYKYNYKFGEINNSSKKLWELDKFDEKGNTIIMDSYRYSDSLDENIIYKYNKDGKIIEISSYNEHGALNEKYLQEYNEKGDVILIQQSTSGGISPMYSYEYKYNETGNVIEFSEYRWKLSKRITYKYDALGYKTEKKFEEGTDKGKKEYYTYNDERNRIEEIHYNNDGIIESKISFKYDTSNNLIETTFYNTDGKMVSKIFCKFDEYGNCLEIISYNNLNEPETKWEFILSK